MKKALLTLAAGLLISLGSIAQNYSQSIGVRAGLLNGITYKAFVGDNAAFEGLIASRWRGGLEFTGLYELHYPAFEVENLQFYVGGGGHVGLWRRYAGHPWWDEPGPNAVVLGLDGILGLEYTFREAPINISLDWKPELNLAGYYGVWVDEGALSIRYYW